MRTALAAGFLATLALSTAVYGCFHRRDFPGTVTFVSPPSSDSPFLHIVFDKGLDSDCIPLGRNRGYWIEGMPPGGLGAAVHKGDRLVYRWDRLDFALLGWSLDRLEYRIEAGSKRSRYSEDSATRFWGILAGICLAPLVLGSLAALLIAIPRAGKRKAVEP